MTVPKQKRRSTHPRRVDRQRRALELQERMSRDLRTVADREHDRGHHQKCVHGRVAS